MGICPGGNYRTLPDWKGETILKNYNQPSFSEIPAYRKRTKAAEIFLSRFIAEKAGYIRVSNALFSMFKVMLNGVLSSISSAIIRKNAFEHYCNIGLRFIEVHAKHRQYLEQVEYFMIHPFRSCPVTPSLQSQLDESFMRHLIVGRFPDQCKPYWQFIKFNPDSMSQLSAIMICINAVIRLIYIKL